MTSLENVRDKRLIFCCIDKVNPTGIYVNRALIFVVYEGTSHPQAASHQNMFSLVHASVLHIGKIPLHPPAHCHIHLKNVGLELRGGLDLKRVLFAAGGRREEGLNP